jgi:hypothetical protein
MRSFRGSKGPFKERLFFPPQQIESICEDALRSVDLLPDRPSPVRIERFVEKKFGICPDYVELPDGVLGYTAFTPNGPSRMVVARTLSEANTRISDRRINTTLAHESGHCLLHAHLFALAEMPPGLFKDDAVEPSLPKILCRDEATATYGGKWWEFQANASIGPLLLPKQLVGLVIQPFLEARGLLGIEVLPDGARRPAELALSEIFDVNPARIRLEQLYPPSTQPNLYSLQLYAVYAYTVYGGLDG